VPTLPLAGLIVGTGAVILFRAPLNRLTAGQRPILEKGWGEDLVQSAFELFETFISYFTNSLSFVRLGAFAIAHVGLSRVVLILSEGSSGWLQWVIILIGALVIVGFEGLIVGIQTLRLEYYEFFGKFFQGGGHAFQPFGLPGGEET
jgi:V/A-type H+-transporting ATPase subunit I